MLCPKAPEGKLYPGKPWQITHTSRRKPNNGREDKNK